MLCSALSIFCLQPTSSLFIFLFTSTYWVFVETLSSSECAIEEFFLSLSLSLPFVLSSFLLGAAFESGFLSFASDIFLFSFDSSFSSYDNLILCFSKLSISSLTSAGHCAIRWLAYFSERALTLPTMLSSRWKKYGIKLSYYWIANLSDDAPAMLLECLPRVPGTWAALIFREFSDYPELKFLCTYACCPGKETEFLC